MQGIRVVLGWSLSALVLWPAWVQAVGTETPASGRYREGEVLVTWSGREMPEARTALRDSLGLAPLRTLRDGRSEQLALPSYMDVAAALKTLRAHPEVAYAEPNYLRQPMAAIPNDPYFADQWGVLNTGQANFVDDGPAGVPGGDLNLTAAWDADGDGVADRVGDGSVIVAIIDEGVDVDHPDLIDNLLPGYDFDNNDNNPNPDYDYQNHGTLIAGIIGAAGDNGLGVAGVAWHVGMLPLQFDFDVATEVAALEYAAAQGARVVNASFGSPDYSQTEYDAMAALGDDGVLVVVSAGNNDANLDRSTLGYPAAYDLPNLLTVAATNRQDQIASFSTYGPITVDVAAPGLQIVSTSVGGGYVTDPGVSGSSFSAAYLSGLAALTWMTHPQADYREIIARLMLSAEPGDGIDQRTAGGRPDAAQALEVSAQPVLVVRSLAVDPEGNGVLDPGETAILRIEIENLWQSAVAIDAELATGDALVASGPTASYGTLGRGERATADFEVSVPSDLAAFQRIDLDLHLSWFGGGTMTRKLGLEYGALQNGVPVQTVIGTDFYDEFQTLYFSLDTLPEGHDTLTLEVDGGGDLDLLVGVGSPAGYSIGLAGSGAFVYDIPDAQVGAAPHGNEFVNIGDPQPGTYFLTVINYDQASDRSYTVQAYTSAGGRSNYRNSTDAYYASLDDDDGGGSWGTWTLLPLLAAVFAGLRRRPL